MNDIFVTNTYRVLKVMYNNSRQVGKETYCPIGQREVAEDLGLSRAIVNKIFNELKTTGYIIMLSRGNWQLTEHANEIVRTIETLKD